MKLFKKYHGVLLFTISYVFCSVIERPQNAVVYVGQPMSFKCRTTNGSIVTTWKIQRPSESFPRTIFTNWNFSQKIQLQKFKMVVNEYGSGALYSNDTQLDDAGSYSCGIEVNYDLFSSQAELIVLASDPNCNSSAHVKKVNEIEVWCNISYSGNFYPAVKWFRNNRNIIHQIAAYEDNKNKWFYYNTIFQLNASDNGVVFRCVFHFQPRTPIVSTQTDVKATNIPDFVYKWSFTASFWYALRHIRIEPQKTVYKFGDRLQCSADGNPSPNYTWSSVSGTHDVDHREGPTLVLDENDFNPDQSYSYQCTAFSSYFDSKISATVNISIGHSNEWRNAVLILGSIALFLFVVAILVSVIRFKDCTLKYFCCTVAYVPDIVQQMDNVRNDREVENDNRRCQREIPVYAEVNKHFAETSSRNKSEEEKQRKCNPVDRDDIIQYLDLNEATGVMYESEAAAAANYHTSQFSQSEYASIDHTMEFNG